MEEVAEVKKDSSWVTSGPIGSRSAVLQFRCSALSKAPVNPPGDVLHMTYKTVQAETKLLAAVLNAHGLREVSDTLVASTLRKVNLHTGIYR